MIGVVLAGGRSKRMGRDKALLSYKDQPLIEIAVYLLKTVCSEVYISCRKSQSEDLAAYGNLIIDSKEDLGPLEAIRNALTELGSGALFLPVDMPLMTEELLNGLSEKTGQSEKSICYKVEDNIMPFPSYFRHEMTPAISECIELNQLSVRRFIDGNESVEIIPSQAERAFFNCNTPEMYAELSGL